MSKCARKFDKELLDKAILEANAQLQGEYSKLNGMCIIKYTCKCSKDYEKKFISIIYYGGAYCKECIKKNKTEKTRNTCTERYGVINPSQLQEIKDKKNETYDKHFGCHPLQSKEIQEKRNALHMEKYGCENPSQRPEIKEKIKKIFDEKYDGHPMFNESIKEKVKETCLNRYGGYPSENEIVKNKIRETFIQNYGGFPSQHPDIKEKIKDIFNEKYGGYPGSNQNIKDKIKETCLEKYGVETPFQNEEVKEKIKQTCRKKYGTDNPIQNMEIMEKTQRTGKKYKKYTLPSGKIINIQGYEHFALNILLQKYSEDQILTERKNVPRITYKYNDETERYYFPDIYIPSENKIIEVKSTWTYSKEVDKNTAKWNATREKGYICEVWIFNSKGVRIMQDNDIIKI
jgi:hypothetical protein